MQPSLVEQSFSSYQLYFTLIVGTLRLQWSKLTFLREKMERKKDCSHLILSDNVRILQNR